MPIPEWRGGEKQPHPLPLSEWRGGEKQPHPLPLSEKGEGRKLGRAVARPYCSRFGGLQDWGAAVGEEGERHNDHDQHRCNAKCTGNANLIG